MGTKQRRTPDPGQGSSVEAMYAASVTREHRKSLGQFFTPPATAALMAEWVAGCNPTLVLDPAVGTGCLLRAVHLAAPAAAVVGYDIDAGCLEAARPTLPPGALLVERDFLHPGSTVKPDAVVTNPPYLRRCSMAAERGGHKAFGDEHGIKLSGLSNAYIMFSIKALSLLPVGGRASILIPAEWANANFGQALKAYLLKRGILRKVFYFSHDNLVFDDNLSTGCVLMCEASADGAPPPMVETFYVRTPQPIRTLQHLHDADGVVRKSFHASDLAGALKWDHLVSNATPGVVPGLVPLAQLARTRRGITTGANGFFHVGAGQAEAAGISAWHLEPCVGKAVHVPGYLFSDGDMASLRRDGMRCLLVRFAGAMSALDLEHVAAGEASGVSDGYVARSRTPWFSMEKQVAAPIWASVFGRSGVRFVVNDAGAANLSTFHCVYPHDASRTATRAMAACLNSAAMQARSRANVRVYGGGLLKVEPGDLLQFELPDLRKVSDATMCRLARLFDEGAAAARVGGNFGGADLEAAVLQATGEAASVT